jgi:hypothetical protein
VTTPDPLPDIDGPRPWEHPEAVRRDIAPHRGNWLLLLAVATLLLGVSSLALVVPGWLAVPFGFLVDRLAAHDVRRMRAGTMDPAGHAQARRAQKLCEVGTLLGAVGASGCPLYVVLGILYLVFVVRR